MSAMSELAAQHDEARDLSGIDLVECERDHYKEQVRCLRALLSESTLFLANFPCNTKEQRQHLGALEANIETALAATADPATDDDLPF